MKRENLTKIKKMIERDQIDIQTVSQWTAPEERE